MASSDTSPMSEREEIAALKARIAILEEQLRLATVMQFAPKSEKLASLAQLDLFNEAEVLAAKPDEQAQASEIEVPAHTRERSSAPALWRYGSCARFAAWAHLSR